MGGYTCTYPPSQKKMHLYPCQCIWYHHGEHNKIQTHDTPTHPLGPGQDLDPCLTQFCLFMETECQVFEELISLPVSEKYEKNNES